MAPTQRKSQRFDENGNKVVPEKGFDHRHPLYLGDWKRSIPHKDEDLAVDDLDEPHLKRKHAILAKHPEIKNLYGIDTRTKYITVALVSIQIALAYTFGKVITDQNVLLALVAYVIGGSITSVFGVLIHEVCHNLAFESQLANRFLGLVANIPIVFPIAQSFRRYHLEHHAYQGVVGKDPDLPLEWEYKLLRANPVTKLFFLFIYPLMYVIRGAAMQKEPSKWELVNWVWTITTDILVWTYCGPRGLLYLFLSLWFGYGIHPGAAHFIQEHFTFENGQETYSYYGDLNSLTMNIGYHNEHHDFTKVAWSKLPAIKSMAPEFYDSLAAHYSWTRCLWDFVWNPTMGPQSRVVRSNEDHTKGRKMVNS
ncbi:fatty acid desaturase-domain-containing protein [Cladochytrium replicatum]|nr:fatty acid desaturase-domain-containing protein [Cladochytrium replicatum]